MKERVERCSSVDLAMPVGFVVTSVGFGSNSDTWNGTTPGRHPKATPVGLRWYRTGRSYGHSHHKGHEQAVAESGATVSESFRRGIGQATARLVSPGRYPEPTVSEAYDQGHGPPRGPAAGQSLKRIRQGGEVARTSETEEARDRTIHCYPFAGNGEVTWQGDPSIKTVVETIENAGGKRTDARDVRWALKCLGVAPPESATRQQPGECSAGELSGTGSGQW